MRPRWLYAAQFTWNAVSSGRFTAPFLQNEANFNDFEIGLALAFQISLISLLSTPAGAFADRFEKKIPSAGRVIVIAVGLVISTIAVLLHSIDYHGEGYRKLSWYLALRFIYSCGVSLINPTLDGLTLAHLEKEGSRKSEFGKERLHGAIWWAIGNILLGFSLDKYGFAAVYFWTIAVFFVTLIALFFYARSEAAFMIEQQRKRAQSAFLQHNNYGSLNSENVSVTVKIQQNDHSRVLSISSLFMSIFGSIVGLAFLFSCTALVSGFSVVENLIFLLFERMGASWTMCGLSVLVTVLFEFPIFHFSPELLTAFGIIRLQYIACVAYIIRVIGYGFIPSGHPYRILYLEQLHGITYGCFRIASVEYVAQLSPDGYEASGQGLLVTITGIGSFVGLLLGGYMEEYFGATIMYRTMALVVLVGMLTLFGANTFYGKNDAGQKS